MGSLTYLDANGNWITSPDGNTGGTELTDGIIETRYLADYAVTTIKVADASITNEKIVGMDGQKLSGIIDGTLLGLNSVPGSRLALGSVDSSVLSNDILQSINDAYVIANGKNKVFYQTSMPTGTHADGDMWFDTDDGYRIYVYHSGAWEDSQDDDIGEAISLASGKSRTFYQADPPATADDGDIWFDSNDGNAPYVRDGMSWVSARDRKSVV